MIIDDLNRKFTVDKYCSKLEMSKALGSSLIDPLWNRVVSFRRENSTELSILDAFGKHFSLININEYTSRITTFVESLSEFNARISKFQPNSLSKITYERENKKLALKYVAKAHNIEINDIALTNIIEGRKVDSIYDKVVSYWKVLSEFALSPEEEIGEEFLGKYLALLLDRELISFYRTKDIETDNSRLLIDREFEKGVPANLNEELMNVLLKYLSNKNEPKLTRALASIFMFNFIKPFDDFNEELSVLVAKNILSENLSKRNSALIPVENLLVKTKEDIEVEHESRKTADFTYYFANASVRLAKVLEGILDRIVEFNAQEISFVERIGDDPVKVKEEFGIEIPKKAVFEPQFEEPARPRVVPQKEVSIPAIEDVKLSEKELKARENELLESDPYLKKGQAHFYVRHCTPGKFYTIQQYKKCEGCVYETARTSMDNLAKQGYYRREQIKNKFVYSPISKE